jgi:hypothetical protein
VAAGFVSEVRASGAQLVVDPAWDLATSMDPPLLGCSITTYVPQYHYLLCLSNIATTLSNYLFV